MTEASSGTTPHIRWLYINIRKSGSRERESVACTKGLPARDVDT